MDGISQSDFLFKMIPLEQQLIFCRSNLRAFSDPANLGPIEFIAPPLRLLEYYTQVLLDMAYWAAGGPKPNELRVMNVALCLAAKNLLGEQALPPECR